MYFRFSINALSIYKKSIFSTVTNFSILKSAYNTVMLPWGVLFN